MSGVRSQVSGSAGRGSGVRQLLIRQQLSRTAVIRPSRVVSMYRSSRRLSLIAFSAKCEGCMAEEDWGQWDEGRGRCCEGDDRRCLEGDMACGGGGRFWWVKIVSNEDVVMKDFLDSWDLGYTGDIVKKYILSV